MKEKLRSIGMALLLCLFSFFVQAQTITVSSIPQTVIQYAAATAFQLQVSTTTASDGNFKVTLPAGMHVVDLPTFSAGSTPVTITYDQYNNTSFQISFIGLLPSRLLTITYLVRAGCNVSQFNNVSLAITDLSNPQTAILPYTNPPFNITQATASYSVLPLISNNPDPIPLNINDHYSWDYEIIGGNNGVPFTGVLRFDDAFRSGINITGIEAFLNGSTVSLPVQVIQENPTHSGNTADGSVSYLVNLNNFSNTDHLIITEYGQVMNCLRSSNRVGGVGLSSITISYGPFLGNYCGNFTTTRNIIDAGNNPNMVRTADNLSKNNAGFDYDAFASSTCFTTTGTPGNVKHRVVTYTNNGSSASLNTLFRMSSQTVDINVLVDANSLQWRKGSDLPSSPSRTYATPPVANADFYSDWTNPDLRDVFITVIPRNNCMINSRTLALARYTINFGTVAAGETITVEWDEYYCCPNDDQLSQNFRPLGYACYYTNECGSYFATDFVGTNSNALRASQVMEPIAFKNMEGNADHDILTVDGEQQIIRIKDKTFLLQELSSVFIAENAFIDIDFLTECGLSWNTGGKDNGNADRYDIQFASRDGSVQWLPVVTPITGSDLMPSFTIPNDATYTTAFGWRARFSITDLATKYGWTTPDEIGTGLQTFVRDAELSFNVRARCDCHPGPTTHFIEKIYLVPQYAPSCETCRLPFYQIGNYINVTCVGCKTPGISIDAPVILERAGQNVGLADTDDNGIPDDFVTLCNDPSIPSAQQCNLKLATLNDIMRLQVAGNFSDGDASLGGFEYNQLLTRPDPIALNYFYYQVELPTSHFNSIGNAAGGSGISINKNDIKISLTEDAGSVAITGPYVTYISRASSTAYAVYDWTTPFPDDVLTVLFEIPRSSFVLGTSNTQYQTDATSPHHGGRSIVNVDLNFTIANVLAYNYKEISLKFLMYLSDRTGVFEGIAPDVSCKGEENCTVIPLNEVQHGSLFWCRRGEGTFNYNPRFTDATFNPIDAENCQKQIAFTNLISVSVDGGQAYDLFPHEYRDLGHMGSIQFRIPPGYSISGAQIHNGYEYNQVEVSETVNLAVPQDFAYDATTGIYTYTPLYRVPELADFVATGNVLKREKTLYNTSTVKNATTVMDELNNRTLTVTMRPACGADAPYIIGDVTTTPGYSAHMTLIKGSGPIVLNNGVNNYSQNNYDSEITTRGSDFTFHAPSDNLSLTYSSGGGQQLTVFNNSTSFQIRLSNIDLANLPKFIDASNAYLEFNGLDPSLQITSITRLINGVPTAAAVDPQHANRYLLGTIHEGEIIDYTVTLSYNCGQCDVSQSICLNNNFTIGYNWFCNGDQPCGAKDPLPFTIKSVQAGLSLAQTFSNLNLCSNNIGYNVTVTSSQQGVVNGFQYTTTLPVGVTYAGIVSTNIANVVTTNILGQQVLSWTDINPAFSLSVKENRPAVAYSFNLQSSCTFVNNQPVSVKAAALTYCASTTVSTKTDNITLSLGTAIINQDDITVGALDCSNTNSLVIPLTIHGSVLYNNTVVVQLATGVTVSSVSNGGVYNATTHTVTWTIDPSFVYAGPGLSVSLVNNTIQTASNNIITFTQPRQARCSASSQVCDITPVVKTYSCPACITTPVTLTASAPGFCPGGNVVLTANSISGAVYQWYKDGVAVTNPSSNTAVLTVTNGGAYKVICTNLFLCNPNSNTVNITASPRLPLQLSPAGQSLAVCKDGSLTLTAIPAGYQNYYWHKGTTLIAVTSVPTLTVQGTDISSPTAYRVDVLGNANGCAASAGTTVTLAPVPTVVIAPAVPISICPNQITNTLTAHVTPTTAPSGSSYSYQWYLNGNPLPASNAATINAITLGSYTVKVTETTNVAACGVTSIPVVVNPVTASSEFGNLSFSAAGNFCLQNIIQIINVNNSSPKSGVTYTWNYGSGASPATSSGFTPVSNLLYRSTGTKTVTLTINDNGCSFTKCQLMFEITNCGSCQTGFARTLGTPGTTTVLQSGNYHAGAYNVLGDVVFETGTFTLNPGTIFYVDGQLNWSPCTQSDLPQCCVGLTKPTVTGSITLRNGANFVMNNAKITSRCTSIAWKGIAIDNHSAVTININNSEISNSENGLYDLYINPIANSKPSIKISNSKFINNGNSSINFSNGGYAVGANSMISNNTFSWSAPIPKPFASLTQSPLYINISNGNYLNMPVSGNNLTNSRTGILAVNSVINVNGNTFSQNNTSINLTNYSVAMITQTSLIDNNIITIPVPAANAFTTGISAEGSFKIRTNTINGFVNQTNSYINIPQVGISCNAYISEISSNTITGTDAAIVPVDATLNEFFETQSLLIKANTLINPRYGIYLNSVFAPIVNIRIDCNRFVNNKPFFTNYGLYIVNTTSVNAQGGCTNNLPVFNTFSFVSANGYSIFNENTNTNSLVYNIYANDSPPPRIFGAVTVKKCVGKNYNPFTLCGGHIGARSEEDMASSEVSEELSKIASLGQNIPNPFTESTSIPYYLPEDAIDARLVIYENVTGHVIEEVKINEVGAGSITFAVDRFASGIYLYTLIVNGEMIGQKKMIIVK